MSYKANCSHNLFKYYSFKVKGWLDIPLDCMAFDPAANQTLISYCEDVDIETNVLCAYHINIRMTQEMHKHLQSVVII
jgi:hypothetical protein